LDLTVLEKVMNLDWHSHKRMPPAFLPLLALVKMKSSGWHTTYGLCRGYWTNKRWELEGGEGLEVVIWAKAPEGVTDAELVAGYQDTLPPQEEIFDISRDLPSPGDPELDNLAREVIWTLGRGKPQRASSGDPEWDNLARKAIWKLVGENPSKGNGNG
jgi:hypothetical protein